MLIGSRPVGPLPAGSGACTAPIGLVCSLPEYSAFFALLAVLMWVYAVTGVFWFAGLMEEAGFSTLINALGAMFQVCVAVAVAVAVWLCVHVSLGAVAWWRWCCCYYSAHLSPVAVVGVT